MTLAKYHYHTTYLFTQIKAHQNRFSNS